MEGKTALAVIGAAGIVYFVGSKAASAAQGNIKFQIGQPQIDNSQFTAGIINVDLPITIENKNLFSINIQNFTGVITYGNITLTNVNIPASFILLPGKTQTVTIDIAIPIQTVLNDIFAAIAAGNIWSTVINKIYLNGTLTILSVTPIQIPLKNIPIPIA